MSGYVGCGSRRLCRSLEAALRTASLTVVAATGHIFEDDVHVFGDGNKQGHNGKLALANMVNQHDGDTGLSD